MRTEQQKGFVMLAQTVLETALSDLAGNPVSCGRSTETVKAGAQIRAAARWFDARGHEPWCLLADIDIRDFDALVAAIKLQVAGELQAKNPPRTSRHSLFS